MMSHSDPLVERLKSAEQCLYDLLHYTGHRDCQHDSAIWHATKRAEAHIEKVENDYGESFRFTKFN